MSQPRSFSMEPIIIWNMAVSTQPLIVFAASHNKVLLVEIEGLVWYTIYYHLPVGKGVSTPLYLSTNQTNQ